MPRATRPCSRPTATRSSQAVLDAYFSRYDGVDHAEHSVSEEAYEAWVRWRLRDFTTAAGVGDAHVEVVVEALRATDQARMVAYPEAAATLASLRAAGLAVGVCSNWGWELDAYLDQVGLLHLVDAAVTSARAGSRKPHPRHLHDAPPARSTSTPARSSSSGTPGSPTCAARAGPA